MELPSCLTFQSQYTVSLLSVFWAFFIPSVLGDIFRWDSFGLPRWLSGKESASNAGDTEDSGSISGLGRSPGGGNGNPLQYFCLENSTDRGARWAMVYGVAKIWTQVSMHKHP